MSKRKIKGVIYMNATMVKPIKALTVVSEKEYVEKIEKSLCARPTENAKRKNSYALDLLRKARKG